MNRAPPAAATGILIGAALGASATWRWAFFVRGQMVGGLLVATRA